MAVPAPAVWAPPQESKHDDDHDAAENERRSPRELASSKSKRQQQQQQQKQGDPAQPQAQTERAETPRDSASLAAALAALEAMDADALPELPRPKAPQTFPAGTSAAARLERIQSYISSLEYNHTGRNYFKIRKDRGAKRLAGTAREIIRESLPIKCIEAVVLGFYLTLGMADLVRIPVRFQSALEQNGRFVFKHIVMVVGHNGMWGAIGLSRKRSLMTRRLRFPSLSALLQDFRAAYEALGHEMQHVGIGLPFGHCELSVAPIHWRPLLLEFSAAQQRTWDARTDAAIDGFAGKLDAVSAHVSGSAGRLPQWFTAQHPTQFSERAARADKHTRKAGRRRARVADSGGESASDTDSEAEGEEAEHEEADELSAAASSRWDEALPAQFPSWRSRKAEPLCCLGKLPAVSIPTLDGGLLEML